ncbi:hypothetical protein ABK040_012300 [Willaertia magna]
MFKSDDLERCVDTFQNKLLIAKRKTNSKFPSNQFEIYLGEPNSNWPYFSKITRETLPVPLEQGEFIKLISGGKQFIVIVTNFSKCYMFGDFLFTNASRNRIVGELLAFKENDSNLLQNQLKNCKITHLDCGESFIILKDDLNRFWYAGKSCFGKFIGEHKCYYEFIQLNYGDLIDEIENNCQIDKVVAGEFHVAICVDDKYIYCIGNNFNKQLGISNDQIDSSQRKLSDFSFKQSEWNLNAEFKVKELACSRGATIILTTCGKLFKTYQHWNYWELIVPVKLVSGVQKILTVGTNDQITTAISSKGRISLVEDGNTYLDNASSTLNKCKFPNKLLEMKLGTGQGDSNYIISYIENEAKVMKIDSREIITLKTELPIHYVKTSEKYLIIFCFNGRASIDDFKAKLLSASNSEKLFDIKFLF